MMSSNETVEPSEGCILGVFLTLANSSEQLPQLLRQLLNRLRPSMKLSRGIRHSFSLPLVFLSVKYNRKGNY